VTEPTPAQGHVDRPLNTQTAEHPGAAAVERSIVLGCVWEDGGCPGRGDGRRRADAQRGASLRRCPLAFI